MSLGLRHADEAVLVPTNFRQVANVQSLEILLGGQMKILKSVS